MGKQAIKDEENAVTPILGAVLMVFLTFVLAGATVAAIYDNGAIEHALTKTPIAVIEIEEVVGVIPNPPNPGGYDDNYITLIHKGGNSLLLDSTTIILSGDGSSYVCVVGQVGDVGHVGGYEYGDIVVNYFDLTKSGKLSAYKTRNPSVKDNIWSTGEQLILRGDDSINGTDASTVLVSVNGISNTSNNYGFKSGTTVTIKIFDKTTQRIIAEGTAIVKSAE